MRNNNNKKLTSHRYSPPIDTHLPSIMASLTTKNAVVLEFYKKHKLDFDTMNVLFVNIMNKLLAQTSPHMDGNFALTLTNEIKNMHKKIDTSNEENNKSIETKLNQMRTEYVNDLKNALSNPLMLRDILGKYTNDLHEKTVHDMDTKINEIKTIANSTSEQQNEINKRVTEVLRKFDNSNKKGNMSEMATYNLMRSLYSEKQLKIVSTTKESGDILLTRNDKPLIMIENKDYKETVSQTEVDKFIRDIKIQNCSGVFISQSSNIANKNSYEINFYGNNIGVYISNLNYNLDVLQIAIQTIDTIKNKIKETVVTFDDMNLEDELTMDKEQLDILNTQFTIFVNSKLTHIKTIKEFSKKLITETELMELPIVDSIIAQMYGTHKNSQWKCDRPGCDFMGKNKGALASHLKAHLRKEEQTN